MKARQGPSSLRAVLRRELRSALLNRYLQVFGLLALLGGLSAAVFTEAAEAAVFTLLQFGLYLVPLFALLIGLTSARAEREEWPLLFSQPAPRTVFVRGKFLALLALFALVLLPLFLPAALAGAGWRAPGQLYWQSLALAGCFGGLGLCLGCSARDGVQALLLGLGLWLLLLCGFDLLALFAAHWPVVQGAPDAWVGGLMLNPLGAFRVHALFALGQIPAEAAGKSPLTQWWLAHPGLWFGVLCGAWMAGLLGLAGRQLNRWEE